MDKIVVIGGNPLSGSVSVGGAKNAVLPAMAATLLCPGVYTIRRVPDLRDTRTMAKLLEIIGATVSHGKNEMVIDTTACDTPEAPYDLVKTMRASFYVLGPLLSRFGHAKVSLPGGCAWGPRPVNFHVAAMEALGAETALEGGYVIARGRRLTGTDIAFDVPSVGATGNTVMAAVMARGTTVIRNAAREPEIVSLCDFLRRMGAAISGAGTDTLTIEGVRDLKPANFEVIPDRIEAATFLIAGALAGERITVEKVDPGILTAVLVKLQGAGAVVTESNDSVSVSGAERLRPVSIRTAVYPGFPTDVQAQWTALMAVAEGTSTITDTIYHDRFTHVAELMRLGADIRMSGNTAIVTGQKELRGAAVMSTDIRASASLILAGLVARGRTDISRVYHIDRGYEKIEEKFKGLGAEIWREAE
ncbi:MAG: UDP-N-acetylglucosamine 1-carboxyvinyltransferase [Fidelibacterota bacterium]